MIKKVLKKKKKRLTIIDKAELAMKKAVRKVVAQGMKGTALVQDSNATH